MTKIRARHALLALPLAAAVAILVFASTALAACNACFNYPPQSEPSVDYTPPPPPVAPLAYNAPVVPPTPVMSYPVAATVYAAPIYAPVYAPVYSAPPAAPVSCDLCLGAPSPVGPTSLPGVYDYSGAGLNQPGLSYLVPSLGGMVETGNPQQALQLNEQALRGW